MTSATTPRVWLCPSAWSGWIDWDYLVDIGLIGLIRRVFTAGTGIGGVTAVVRHSSGFLLLVLPGHSSEIIDLLLMNRVSHGFDVVIGIRIQIKVRVRGTNPGERYTDNHITFPSLWLLDGLSRARTTQKEKAKA